MKILLTKSERKNLTALREVVCTLIAWGVILTGLFLMGRGASHTTSYALTFIIGHLLGGILVAFVGVCILGYFSAKGWCKTA